MLAPRANLISAPRATKVFLLVRRSISSAPLFRITNSPKLLLALVAIRISLALLLISLMLAQKRAVLTPLLRASVLRLLGSRVPVLPRLLPAPASLARPFPGQSNFEMER